MSETIVYISIAGAGEEVSRDFPYRLCLHADAGAAPTEETLILHGEGIYQIREAFLQEGISKLHGRLRYFYQSFKEQRFSSIRYFIISPVYEPLGAAITLELAGAIRELHDRVSHVPCEIEGLLLLPGSVADSEQKAPCYEFLTKLDNSAPAPFDIVYLLDVDYMKPDYALSETIRFYTTTDVYKSVSAIYKGILIRSRFNDVPAAYSSMGISKLVFPKESWIELLGLRLLIDILLKSRISPFTPAPEAAITAVSELGEFLEELSLPGIIKAASSYSKLEGIGEAIRGLKESPEDVDRVIAEFLEKIDYAVIQTTGGILEKDDVKQKASGFVKEVKEKTEETMDTATHGPFSALAFLSLLLDTDGPYINILRELERNGENLPPPGNLPGYLIGWVAVNPSENLKIVFKEMMAEVKRIYYAHQVPLPEIHSWMDLWNELERMENSPQFENILGSDATRLSELKGSAEIIKQSFENPYTTPLTPEKLRQVLSVFERKSAGNLKSIIERMRSLNEELNRVEVDIKDFKWWRKPLPSYWSLLRERERIRSSLETVRKGLEAEASAIIEKVQRLLPCRTFLLIYEKLNEELKLLEEEVSGFTGALTTEIIIAEERMRGIDFPSDVITHQIAHKDENDINALYHTNPATDGIPGMFEDQFLKQLKPPELSAFYQSGKRSEFLAALYAFALSRFLYLKDWSAEQLMLYLNREVECMTTLRDSCRPFIGIEKIKGVPELNQMECLYIGVEDENKTKFSSHSLSLKGEGQFYSTGKASQITGITLLHGFPVSLIEGWIDWKNCYESPANSY